MTYCTLIFTKKISVSELVSLYASSRQQQAQYHSSSSRKMNALPGREGEEGIITGSGFTIPSMARTLFKATPASYRMLCLCGSATACSLPRQAELLCFSSPPPSQITATPRPPQITPPSPRSCCADKTPPASESAPSSASVRAHFSPAAAVSFRRRAAG